MKRPLHFLALACGLALVSPALSRADTIDVHLAKEMPQVVKYLKSHGYKNVGVLRFRAQKGTEKGARFDMGEINGNMADRLENLLVMNAGQEKKPEAPAFGIIHDAGAVAGQRKVGSWYTNPAERAKLFTGSYPLAWGKTMVKADAFLTGKVSLSKDLKKTTVKVECLDGKTKKIVKVTEFVCDTDRQVVRDCNLPYTLTRAQRQVVSRSIIKASKIKSRDGQQQALQQAQQIQDDFILQQADRQQQQPTTPQNPPGTQDGPPTTQQAGGISLKITANGTEITPPVSQSQVGDYTMPCPPRGSDIVFSLTNTSSKELAVYLKVGGVSTIGEQTDPPEMARKWVIPPGKTYNVKGYYVGDMFDSLKKFAVKSREEARQTNPQLDDSIDKVEMIVYESNEGDPMTISRGVNARGLRRGVATRARSSFGMLKTSLLKEGRFKKVRGRDGGEVIVPDEGGMPTTPLNEKDFPNPQEIKRLAITIQPAGQPVQPQVPSDPINPDQPTP